MAGREGADYGANLMDYSYLLNDAEAPRVADARCWSGWYTKVIPAKSDQSHNPSNKHSRHAADHGQGRGPSQPRKPSVNDEFAHDLPLSGHDHHDHYRSGDDSIYDGAPIQLFSTGCS